MKVSCSFATLAFTLALFASASAETNVAPPQPVDAKLDLSSTAKVQSTAQKSMGFAENIASKTATIALQATRGAVRYVQNNPKKSVLAAAAVYTGHKTHSGMKKYEKQYLDRYHRMQGRKFITPGDPTSRSFILNADGMPQFYTYHDEAVARIEAAYDKYYTDHPISRLAPKLERLAVRYSVQQVALGLLSVGDVEAILRTTVLSPDRDDLWYLLLKGQEIYRGRAFMDGFYQRQRASAFDRDTTSDAASDTTSDAASDTTSDAASDTTSDTASDTASDAGTEDSRYHRYPRNAYDADSKPEEKPRFFYEDSRNYFEDFFSRWAEPMAPEPTAAQIRLEKLRNRITAELKGDDSIKELKELKRKWLLAHHTDQTQREDGSDTSDDEIDMADTRQIFDDLIAAEQEKLAALQMIRYQPPAYN